jgi:multisubunit Na+/H+ antiporter MnhB subunit
MEPIVARVGGVAIVLVLISYAIYENASEVKQFLGVVFLVAIVLAAIAFYFWQRSTRRQRHPWEE